MGQAHSGPNLMTGFLWRRRKTVVVDHEGNIDADAAKKNQTISGINTLEQIKNSAGEILEMAGYDNVWPPKSGPNVLDFKTNPCITKKQKEYPPAEVLAAEAYMYAIAAQRNIDLERADSAAYCSILALSRYERAFARLNFERDAVSARKQRKGDGWGKGADDNLLNNRLRWFREAKEKNLIAGKYMHSMEKKIEYNAISKEDYAYMRVYMSAHSDKFV